jgi:hypothetical protein
MYLLDLNDFNAFYACVVSNQKVTLRNFSLDKNDKEKSGGLHKASPPDHLPTVIWESSVGLVHAGCFDSHIQFAFGSAQVFLGFDSVSLHVVVVRGARMFHFIDGLTHVLVNLIEVVPVVDLGGHSDTRDK